MFNPKDFTIVICSVEERTTDACKYLLSKAFHTEDVHVINAYPFTEALHQTFALGIKENRKWTVRVDADVLVTNAGIEKMIAMLDDLEDEVFNVQGHIFDKLFGIDRPAGLRFYRTKHLALIDSLVPTPENALRPESQTYFAMQEKGYKLIQTTDIVGLHDFEQSYEDLFRTAYIHGKKHLMFEKTLIPYWKKLSRKDKDYAVALLGFKAAKKYKGTVSIDKKLPDEVAEIFNSARLTEKPQLPADAFSLADIQNIIDSQVVNYPMKKIINNPPKLRDWKIRPRLAAAKRTAIAFLKKVKRKLKSYIQK